MIILWPHYMMDYQLIKIYNLTHCLSAVYPSTEITLPTQIVIIFFWEWVTQHICTQQYSFHLDSFILSQQDFVFCWKISTWNINLWPAFSSNIHLIIYNKNISSSNSEYASIRNTYITNNIFSWNCVLTYYWMYFLCESFN